MKKVLIFLFVVLAVLVIGCAKTEDQQNQQAATQNTQTSQQTTQQTSGKVDLAAVKLETSSPSFEVGDRLTIYPTVKNLGDKVDNVEVGLYANGDEINTFVFNFKAGETKSVPYAWYPEEAGEYNLRIVVDPDKKLKESSTSNNEATTSTVIYE